MERRGNAGGRFRNGFGTVLERIRDGLDTLWNSWFVAGRGRFVRGGAAIFLKTVSTCSICSISPDRRGLGASVPAAVGGFDYATACSVCQGARGLSSYRRRPRGAPTAPVCRGTARMGSGLSPERRLPKPVRRLPARCVGGHSSYRRRPVSTGPGMGSGLRRNDGGRRNDGCLSRNDGRGVRRFHRTGPATWGCFPRSSWSSTPGATL